MDDAEVCTAAREALLSVYLQLLAVCVPALQQGFGTAAPSLADHLVCLAVGSSVLCLGEVMKLAIRL